MNGIARAIRNLIRIGVVTDVDLNRGLCRVQTGGMKTTWLNWLTPLSNLHIYTQRNTRQRKARFEDDRKQFENSYLRNEGYAIEVPELYAAIDEDAVTIGKPSEPVEG